jgi:hypothetical protein
VTDSDKVESIAVQRRRESRREEWNEHVKLAELLTRYLDPSCTFWTSLENKPLSRVSGLFQKRRGVRSGGSFNPCSSARLSVRGDFIFYVLER